MQYEEEDTCLHQALVAFRVTLPVRNLLLGSATCLESRSATSAAGRRSACPCSGGHTLHNTKTDPRCRPSTRMRRGLTAVCVI
jgi:hypothetical protein